MRNFNEAIATDVVIQSSGRGRGAKNPRIGV